MGAFWWCTPLVADEPLTPPADFLIEYESASVRSDVSENTTTITPANDAPWTIPVWARWFQVSRDQMSIVVLNDGGNLLASRDPDQIVATVWYVDGASVRNQIFTLGDIMDPADMPRSTSHYVWLETYRPSDIGWEFDLSDGTMVTITYR